MAANTSWAALGKATDLRNRILFTLGLLIVYRLGTFIPVPGIDGAALRDFMEQAGQGIGGMVSMFTGGALGRMGIFALGIMPYISASIIVQLLSSMVPALEQLKKEGEQGRKKINQWTRYGTVVLATFQAYGLSVGLYANDFVSADIDQSFFIASCVITLVGGTMFLMWLGEQITARGIGNGISLIIFAGIIAEMPKAIFNLISQARTTSVNVAFVVAIAAMVIALVVFIVFMERSQRRLLIQYPKRQQAHGVAQGQKSFLPLKINTSGVIPPIFASSLLLMPLTISQFAGQTVAGESALGDFVLTLNQYLSHGSPVYMLLYGLGIVFFCFFYTAVVFNPEETADNLKRNGGFIPGIRPGKNTEHYLDYVLTRITVIGAAYLAFICLVPEFAIARAGIPFYLGGTSLLIVVNVTVDTVTQIQSHLLAHQYGDLIKKAKLKGRLR